MIWKVAAGITVLLVALSIAGKVENATGQMRDHSYIQPHTPPVEASVDETCEEDMACWDCTTMGNLICGPGIGSN